MIRPSMFVSIDIVKHFRITSSKSTSSTKLVPREKAFVLAAHVSPRTPKILGVMNWYCICDINLKLCVTSKWVN